MKMRKMTEWLRAGFFVFCAVGMTVSAEDLQSRVFSMLDSAMSKSGDLEIMDGVTLVQTSDEEAPRSNGSDFGSALLDRIDSFLGARSLRFDLKDLDVRAGVENVKSAAEDVFEPRGKKKKDKKDKKSMIIPLVLAVKAKMALLSAAVGNTIAIIAAKALLVSKIALLLGILLFLKKLVQDPPKEVEHTQIKHKKIVLPNIHPATVYPKGHDWEKESDDFGSKLSNYNEAAQEMAYRRTLSRPLK